MTTHKCDFCRAEISAPPGEVTSVISYLPCFHVLCQTCKSQRFRGPETVRCSVCNHPSLPVQVFDLVVGDQEKLFCRFCEAPNGGEMSDATLAAARGRIEFRCAVCPADSLYCGPCAERHRETSDHEMKLIQTVILPRSQCSTHTTVPAVADCICGMTAHAETGHPSRAYNDASVAAGIQLRARLEVARQDIVAVQKQLAAVGRHRTDVRVAAAKARTAVASEIVELCNALMRRGNDVVTAVDGIEEAKLKAAGKLEAEMKAAQQKLKKIECLLNMTVRLPAAEDPAAPMAAAAFAAGAQQIIDERKARILRGVEEQLRVPARLAYVSDLPPVLNALAALGRLDVDGQLRTPPPSTPTSARMFTVTNAGSVSSAASNNSSVMNPVRSIAAMTVPPSTSAGAITDVLPMTSRQLAGTTMPTGGLVADKPTTVRPPNLPTLPAAGGGGVSLPCGTFSSASPSFLPAIPTSAAPFMSAVMPNAVFLQQQQMRAYNNATNRPGFCGIPPGPFPIAAQQQQHQQRQQQQMLMIRQQQQQQQQQHGHSIPTSQQQHQAMAMAGNAPSTSMAHQLFIQQQQQLLFQQQQRQRNLQDLTGGVAGSQNSPTFPMAGSGGVGQAACRTDANGRRAMQLAELQQQQYMQYLQQQKQRQIAERQKAAEEVQRRRLSSDSVSQPPVEIFENTSDVVAIAAERSSSSLSPDSSSVPTNPPEVGAKRLAAAATDGDEDHLPTAAKRANLDVAIHVTDGDGEEDRNRSAERNPADFPTNSPSITTTTTTNGDAANVDEPRRPSSANSAVSIHSASSGLPPRPMTSAGGNSLTAGAPPGETSPTSLAPKLLLKKKATDGTYEADLIEYSVDVKPNIVVFNRPQADETPKNFKKNPSLKKKSNTTKSPVTRTKAGKVIAPVEAAVPPPSGSRDDWDDYCYVCSQGCDTTTGDLGCCDKCPHVYHNKCHIPAINMQMSELPDDWNCTLCAVADVLTEISHSFGHREILLCSKVILACFADSAEAEPFYHPVPHNVVGYYDVIKSPVCLSEIARRLSESNLAAYKNVESFLDDMNLLFKNCSLFNSPHSDVAISGRRLYALYRDAVRKHLPAYEKRVWVYVTLREENTPPTPPRQRRGGSVGQAKRARREESIGKAPVPTAMHVAIEPLQQLQQPRIEPN